MSNPGLVVLAQAPAATRNLRYFVVEDNIGEAIHIHWNNLRADFSIAEFLTLADQVEGALKNLSAHGYPDITRLEPRLLGMLGAQVGTIVRIEQQRRPLHTLEWVDDNHPASKAGRQVAVFGDEPYIRFGADAARRLKTQDPLAEVDLTVVHFSGDQWRLASWPSPSARAKGSRPEHSNPPRHSVMILAGMSGSGKTTILRDSLSRKQPLFGASRDSAFQGTRLPPVYPEDGIPLDERLRLNTWVHEVDLVRLHQQGMRSRNLIVHFDLYWYLSCAHAWTKAVPSVRSDAQFLEFLLDPKRIAQVFRMIFKFSPLQGGECVVKTLKPEFEVVRARWIAREEKMNRAAQSASMHFLKQFIYREGEEGRRLYDNIHAGWQLAVQSIAAH